MKRITKVPAYSLYNLQPLAKQSLGVLCLDCGWLRISFNRHDYRTCPCPNQTMVDGGRDYLRYGGMSMDRIQVIQVAPAKEEEK